MIRSIVIAGLLMGTATVDAATLAKTDVAAGANVMASSCVVQRQGMPIEQALGIAIRSRSVLTAQRTDYFVREGYSFATKYPEVHCNQIFITVIDTLVRGKV